MTSKEKMSIKELFDLFVQSSRFDEEFEVRFRTNGKTALTQNDFERVHSYLCGNSYVVSQGENHTLKIQNLYNDPRTGKRKISNIRTEVATLPEIEKYCKSNSITENGTVVNKQTKFTQKKRMVDSEGKFIPHAEVTDYGFRAAYSKEYNLKHSSPLARQLVQNWEDDAKTYRLVQRKSLSHMEFISEIRVDMSIVKSSIKNARGAMIPKRTIQESGVFNGTPTYEIEIELNKRSIMNNLSYKFTDADKKTYIENLYKGVRKCIKDVLCAIQGTEFPVTIPEMKRIGSEYQQVCGITDETHSSDSSVVQQRRLQTRDFIGPSSISLEMKHLYSRSVDDDTSTPSIRKHYTVTEKADGERKLLFVNKEGRVYLIDTNMSIQFMGVTVDKDTFKNSIIDGEHVTKDKNGAPLNMYLAFDVYFMNGIDMRGKVFYKPDEKEDGEDVTTLLKDPVKINTRHNALDIVMDNFTLSTVVDMPVPIHIQAKRFVYGSNDAAGGQTIFKACKSILEMEKNGLYAYETDGLIFTPANTAVGMLPGETGEYTPKNWKITWTASFKWKPPQFNTIDFLVTAKKNKDGSDHIRSEYDPDTRKIKQMKALVLRVGFDDKKHGFVNPCSQLYSGEGDKYVSSGVVDGDDIAGTSQQGYRPVAFVPSNPSDDTAHLCHIELKNTGQGTHMYIEDNTDSFSTDMIVEFRYDKTKPKFQRWIPIRVRHDKTIQYRSGLKNYGNGFHVAESVWRSIHNPVSESMIQTGIGIPDSSAEEDDDVYYNGNSSSLTTPLRHFHNRFIKHKLLKSVMRPGCTVMDLAVGKAGDLSKWQTGKASFVFGVDLSKDNIQNRKDGACARFLRFKKQNPENKMKALFVQANSSKNLLDGSATFTPRGYQIVQAVHGEGEKDSDELGTGVYNCFGKGKHGFDVVSCQFALHYFFENASTLHNFITNVSQSCKVGGHFISTCYNGNTLFDRLKDTEMGSSIVGHQDGKRIWEITKRYNSEEQLDDDSCLGMGIDVWQESINKTFMEYLVNVRYLEDVMREYGFDLVTEDEAKALKLPGGSSSFSQYYKKMNDGLRVAKRDFKSYKSEVERLGEAPDMAKHAAQKELSFINVALIFVKRRDVNPLEILSRYQQSIVVSEEPEEVVNETVVAPAPAQPTITMKIEAVDDDELPEEDDESDDGTSSSPVTDTPADDDDDDESDDDEAKSPEKAKPLSPVAPIDQLQSIEENISPDVSETPAVKPRTIRIRKLKKPVVLKGKN